MPIWKQPPIIKVYEALGCLADQRIHVEGNTAIAFLLNIDLIPYQSQAANLLKDIKRRIQGSNLLGITPTSFRN